ARSSTSPGRWGWTLRPATGGSRASVSTSGGRGAAAGGTCRERARNRGRSTTGEEVHRTAVGKARSRHLVSADREILETVARDVADEDGRVAERAEDLAAFDDKRRIRGGAECSAEGPVVPP